MTSFGMDFSGLPELLRYRDLEEFEGPILTELRARSGARYVEKWCAFHEGATRTLVVRSEPRAVAEYLAKRITLLQLLTVPNDDVGFLVDRVKSTRKHVQLVQVSALPEGYLPKRSALHDESLRPAWKRKTEAFLVDTKWDAKLLWELEKLYLTVFAFNFFTAGDNAAPLPSPARTYVLEGYSYGKMFQAFRDLVPANDKAHSTGVMAASPGVLTISAPSQSADRVIATLQAAARVDSEKAYQNVHAWSKLPEKKADSLPETAMDSLRVLCGLLRVDITKVLPVQIDYEKPQILRAGKIVAAYYRLLWRLIDPKWDGVEFLAPDIKRETPSNVYDDFEEDEEEIEDDDDDDDDSF